MRAIFAAMLLGLTLAPAAALAAGQGIVVEGAWIQAPPPGAPTAAGYATITNRGISTDRLTGAQSRAAHSVELHHMSTVGGVMRMRPMVGGAPIGANASLKLSPDGDHLMFIGLTGPLKVGQHVKVVLSFSRAGQVAADFPVRAGPPGGGMAGMHM
jgi:copper(I)-binding protein